VSPKSINYRTNSIIYFKGDQSDKIYILKAGRVVLNYIDIETGQDIHDIIKTGEFFGVKSALGRYAREETALVVVDSKVIAFSIPEFEQLASSNTRIITKMLKVFSNQLRRIHKQVKNLIYMDETINPERGLYSIGEYYIKNKKYRQSIYTLGRYLVYYPSGRYAQEATNKLNLAEKYLSEYGEGGGPGIADSNETTQEAPKPSRSTEELSEIEKKFYNAVSLVAKQDYNTALEEFKEILGNSTEEEYTSKSMYEIGRCFFFLKQHQNSIKFLTNFIQKYPKHPEINEAIYHVAKCNEALGHKEKALGLYKKLLTMIPEADSLSRKVKSAYRELSKD
jgi:TolA-binding protein